MILIELKKKEKLYFDTYKTKLSNKDKIKHLREMANVIEEIDKLEENVIPLKKNRKR
jgi:hypothetical protein